MFDVLTLAKHVKFWKSIGATNTVIQWITEGVPLNVTGVVPHIFTNRITDNKQKLYTSRDT